MTAKKVAKGTVIGTMRAMKNARMMSLVIPWTCETCGATRDRTTLDIKVDAARGASCRACGSGRRTPVANPKPETGEGVSLDYDELAALVLKRAARKHPREYAAWVRLTGGEPEPTPVPVTPEPPAPRRRRFRWKWTESEQTELEISERADRIRMRKAKGRKRLDGPRGGFDDAAKLIEESLSVMP